MGKETQQIGRRERAQAWRAVSRRLLSCTADFRALPFETVSENSRCCYASPLSLTVPCREHRGKGDTRTAGLGRDVSSAETTGKECLERGRKRGKCEWPQVSTQPGHLRGSQTKASFSAPPPVQRQCPGCNGGWSCSGACHEAVPGSQESSALLANSLPEVREES